MIQRVVVLALALMACGPVFTIHTRNSPQRVAVTKQASSPELVFIARFVGSGAVELVAKHAYDVRVTRVVHYGSASFEFGRANPLFELIEIPFGLVMLAFGPAWWESMTDIKSTSTKKVEQHTNTLLAMLNPFQSGGSLYGRVSPDSNADVFADPPVVRAFRVSLPAPTLTISFRALDDDEQSIATGTVQTDAFGRATIANVTGAIGLEVTIAGKTRVIPIEPEVVP